MKVVFLDGNRIGSIADLHAEFSRALSLPEYYGKNLDALHDVLTESADEVGVIAVNTELLAENVGKRRWKSFLRLMDDLKNERADFHFSSDPFALAVNDCEDDGNSAN